MKNSEKTIHLTKLEERILGMLEKTPGCLVPRQQILAEVWPQAQYDMNPSTVDRHIASLRKKINGGEKIRAVYGEGYILVKKPGGRSGKTKKRPDKGTVKFSRPCP